MTTGKKIGELAKKKGINLHKLAEQAEISYNTLYSIVKRKSSKVDMETVRKIALALDVHPIEIMGDESLTIMEYSMDLFERMQVSEVINDAVRARKDSIDRFTHNELGLIIIDLFDHLNHEGRSKAIDYMHDLSDNPKYQQKAFIKQEKPPEGQ